MNKTKACIVVSGFVQGVSFFVGINAKAKELNLTGDVKNRWDGKIEATLRGRKEDVEEMVNWCYKSPSGSKVDGVEVTYASE